MCLFKYQLNKELISDLLRIANIHLKWHGRLSLHYTSFKVEFEIL